MAKINLCACIGKGKQMTDVYFEKSKMLVIDGHAAANGGLQIDDIGVDAVINKMSVEAISDAAAKVARIGKGLIEAGSDKIGDVKEVELQFGITVGAGGRIFVVEGDVKAELKIKLKW